MRMTKSALTSTGVSDSHAIMFMTIYHSLWNPLDVSDDDVSCHSEDSDMTVQKKDAKFINIATRSSAIKTNIHPRAMLQSSSVIWRKSYHKGQASILTKAVIDHDLEAFVHIANLYQTVPQAIGMEEDVMTTILEEDQPDMLDEYIRCTGFGIDMASNRKDSRDTEVTAAVNDENKIYFGLNVDGQKRADLAGTNLKDPVADNARFEIPILWKAAKAKAKAVVEYLAGDRPSTAYRFYASTHSDELAIWLRRTTDLEKLLPTWLGWTVSNMGDSPLIAAIMANNLDMIKLLFQKAPQLMATTVHQK
jgi:hypothetical protein